MDFRPVLGIVAALVAASLVGAPVTMADWGEQATFSAEQVPQSEVHEETPVFQYETLSDPAQDAVRRAIESPDSAHTVYGSEDWPDRFVYTDYISPGQGSYAIVHEGEYYQLYTAAGGGFPIFYWLLELPFVIYGLVLGWFVHDMSRGGMSPGHILLATVPGIGFHLFGPEFDFPLLEPIHFAALGVLAVTGLVAGRIWIVRRG